MAEGFVSSPAFGRELVEHRRLKRTVELPELLRSFDPLRSLVLPDLFLSSSSTDLPLRWLKASELLRFLLHLGALESLIFDILLRLSVLINQLLLALLRGTVEWHCQHRHIVISNGRRYVVSCDGTVIGIIADRQEEDNLVFSGNNEGRLDDDSGSNDVRLNGGIVEPELRADETPGPSTTISRGILGLDSFFESVLEQWLRHQDVSLNSLQTIFESLNLRDLLTTDPLFDAVLTQKKNHMRMDLSHMLETNSELGSEELKEYYPPICWNSTKRLEFFHRLNERLSPNTNASNQQNELKELLLEELESKKPMVFDGEWIHKIDPKFRPSKKYNYESVRELLRFVRNQWCHLPNRFEEFLGLGSAERFYNYFDARFPKLLVVSYGAVSRFCREEKWFEEYS